MSGEADRRIIADHYSAIASAYASHESDRGRDYTRELVEELPVASANRILDIGIGPGLMISAIRQRAASAMIVGVDLSFRMLEEAVRRTDAGLALMDAMRLAFRDDTFDAVTFSFSLFHLPDPEEGMRQAKRVLRPGGHLGVATFFGEKRVQSRAREVLDGLLDEFGATSNPKFPDYATERVSQEKLLQTAKGAGLEVVRAWTKEIRSTTDRSGREILELQKRRIETWPVETRIQFEERAQKALAELSDDYFDVIYPVQYLVARRA